MTNKTLLKLLQEEMKMGLKRGCIIRPPIKLAYHSNRIEGSRLSEECFDYMLNVAHEGLSEEIIKEFHLILKERPLMKEKSGSGLAIIKPG